MLFRSPLSDEPKYIVDSAVFLVNKEKLEKNNLRFDSNFYYLEDQDFFIRCYLSNLQSNYVDFARAIHENIQCKKNKSNKYFEEIADTIYGIRKFKDLRIKIPFEHKFKAINLIKGLIAGIFNYNYFCYQQDIKTIKKLKLLFGKHKKFEINNYNLIKLFFKGVSSYDRKKI